MFLHKCIKIVGVDYPVTTNRIQFDILVYSRSLKRNAHSKKQKLFAKVFFKKKKSGKDQLSNIFVNWINLIKWIFSVEVNENKPV